MTWKKSALIITIFTILVMVASWAFYSMVNQGAADLLSHVFGIENGYAQGGIVILAVLLIGLLLGKNLKIIMKKVFNTD